jgi:hypothetical protein
MVTRFIAKFKYVSFCKISFTPPQYLRQLALPNECFKDNNYLIKRYSKYLYSLCLKDNITTCRSFLRYANCIDMPLDYATMLFPAQIEFLFNKSGFGRVFLIKKIFFQLTNFITNN